MAVSSPGLVFPAAENYCDTQTRARADYYSATLQYKLGSSIEDSSIKDPNAPCAIQGASSVSFEYDWGTDKDTLVSARKYLIKPGMILYGLAVSTNDRACP